MDSAIPGMLFRCIVSWIAFQSSSEIIIAFLPFVFVMVIGSEFSLTSFKIL